MVWSIVLSLLPAAQAAAATTAFRHARLIPVDGPEIPDGLFVIADGRIAYAGPDGGYELPPAATIVDLSGQWLMPGLVDTHSHVGGFAAADASGPIQPGVRVLDDVNVLDAGYRRVVAGGLTTLNVMPGSSFLSSGQTVYLKMRKVGRGEVMTVEDFAYTADDGPGGRRVLGGLKMANGTNPQKQPPFPGTRGKSAQLVRSAFIKAQEYRAKIQAAAGDPAKLPPRDLDLETLVEVLDGRRVVHHHTHRADDIMTVLRLQKEFGFRLVLQHVSEGWKVADQIAAAGVPCSVIVIDAPGGKLEARELRFETGAILAAAGVKVAFHTDDWITDSRLLLRSAALGVRGGMARADALRAVTLAGAEMLDLQDRIGSLTAGKDADFVVLDGDPLSVYTRVRQTWVEGRKVFDLEDPEDHLHADGGQGAGANQTPFLCCADDGGAS